MSSSLNNNTAVFPCVDFCCLFSTLWSSETIMAALCEPDLGTRTLAVPHRKNHHFVPRSKRNTATVGFSINKGTCFSAALKNDLSHLWTLFNLSNHTQHLVVYISYTHHCISLYPYIKCIYKNNYIIHSWSPISRANCSNPTYVFPIGASAKSWAFVKESRWASP